jgi:hypothetical protein
MKRIAFLSLLLCTLFLGSCKKCYQCDTIGEVCSGNAYYDKVQTVSSQAGVYMIEIDHGSNSMPTIYYCHQ